MAALSLVLIVIAKPFPVLVSLVARFFQEA